MIDDLFLSILAQTIRPAKWIIVDDCSTDDSLRKLYELSKGYSWIHILEKKERTVYPWFGYGAVVAHGIKEALGSIDESDMICSFIGVLDADTIVEERYFEKLLSSLSGNPTAVIASGLIATKGGDIFEEKPLPRGCARLYRASFIQDLKGFPITPAPDTILELKARNRGYSIAINSTATGIHRRISSSSGDVDSIRIYGIIDYTLGYDLFSFFLVAIQMFFARGARMSICLTGGFLQSLRNRYPKVDDQEIRSYFSSAWKRIFKSNETRKYAIDHARKRI